MARNRVIYQNEVLFVAPSSTGSQYLNGDNVVGESLLRQVKRVQSINYAFNINRTDSYQFGNLARVDSSIVEAPTVSLDFTYYLTDGKNEHLLGFDNNESTNFLHKDFINDTDGRNFYIYTTEEGRDANAGTIAQVEAQSETKKSVISIGNCYISNYSLNAAIGAMPTVSVSAEASNIQSKIGTYGVSPGINPTDGTQSTSPYKIPSEYVVSGDGRGCLHPGDISVDLGDASLLSAVTDASDTTASHIQSVSIDVPLSRTPMQRVGSAFAFSKTLDTPIRASVSVSAILASKKTSTKSLFTELYAKNLTDLTVTFKKQSSIGSRQGDTAVIFKLDNATLESESYGMSIGDNRTVDYTFSTTIGDPSAASVAGSSAGALSMNASGVYELLQVIETGVSTDTSNKRFNDIGYGTAIAANDEILVVGASGFSNANFEVGAAYIYKNEKGFYRQVQLTSGQDHAAGLSNASDFTFDEDDYDPNVGFDVAVSPQSLIAIGAMNSDFKHSPVAILHPNDDLSFWTVNDVVTGVLDKGTTMNLGQSLAFDKELSGTNQWLVAGAPSAGSGVNEMGNVHVRYGTKGEVNSFVGYPLDKGNTEVAGITVHDANERFGTSVAMHGNVIVAGAPGYSAQSGVAYVYAADGTGPHTAAASWVEVAKLTGVTSVSSNDPAFGAAVDVFGSTIIVGAPSGSAGVNQGEVHVFTTDQNPAYRGWTHATALTPSNPGNNDRFGDSVSMPNSSTIIVGAPQEDPAEGDNAGSVYVFTGGGSNWAETQKITYSGASANDYYGRYESSLATTQKEIFVAGDPAAGVAEKVIRYRI
tara:strand:- start:114 stop:2561 length:2448 start_codon:yes stop_codon:yes gene_type:complete